MNNGGKLGWAAGKVIPMRPIPTNTRFAAAEVMEKAKAQEPWFGIEQVINSRSQACCLLASSSLSSPPRFHLVPGALLLGGGRKNPLCLLFLSLLPNLPCHTFTCYACFFHAFR